jgi:hypothetical protein
MAAITPSRRLAAAAAWLVLLGGGAAGTTTGPTAAQYRKQVDAIGERFLAEVRQDQAKVAAATSDAKRVAALNSFRDAFGGLATRLDRIQPPERAQQAQNLVVSRLRQGADDIRRIVAALKSGSRAKAQQAVADLQADASGVQQALAQLRQKVEK